MNSFLRHYDDKMSPQTDFIMTDSTIYAKHTENLIYVRGYSLMELSAGDIWQLGVRSRLGKVVYGLLVGSSDSPFL